MKIENSYYDKKDFKKSSHFYVKIHIYPYCNVYANSWNQKKNKLIYELNRDDSWINNLGLHFTSLHDQTRELLFL